MSKPRHGLLIGKFYPPHSGHHAAIRTAAAQCGQVTAVVMASAPETIPLSSRIEWLRDEHRRETNVHVVGVPCDVPMDLYDERVWAAQVAVMRAAIRTITDQPIDAVYSADGYGPELASWFDAKFVALPRPRGSPSSSAVRHDLPDAWLTLAPATRAGLTTRAIVVGAESTGTTTVSHRLTEHYRGRGAVWASTDWVGEYGREFTEIKWRAAQQAARAAGQPEPALDHLVWTREDFDAVANEQTRREEQAARTGSPLLICDTDAFATAIWERRYLAEGARAGQPWSLAPLLPRRDVYLLTDHHDVPWHDDGLREGDLAIRAEMTEWFADALTRAGHSWVLLTGTLDQRLKLAVATIDQLLRHRARFAAPLTGPGFER